MVSLKAMGVLLWLETLDPRLPKRKEMAFRRENKISIENMVKFKEERKMKNRMKWRKQENSSQNKPTRASQCQV